MYYNDSGIVRYNLDTHQQSVLTTAGAGCLGLDGSTAVWTGGPTIYSWNMDDPGQTSPTVVKSVSTYVDACVKQGDHLAYETVGNVMLDNAGTTTQIGWGPYVPASEVSSLMGMDGDYVAWNQHDPYLPLYVDQCEVELYRISDGYHTHIVDSNAPYSDFQQFPYVAISDDWVVFDPAQTPEPATFLMTATALLCLLLYRTTKKP